MVYYPNVRWLKTKLAVFRTNLSLMADVNLVTITYTNLDISVHDAEVCGIGEWRLLRKDPLTSGGGCVMLAARSPIYIERMQPYEATRCEDLWTRFTVKGCYLYINVVSHPRVVMNAIFSGSAV